MIFGGKCTLIKYNLHCIYLEKSRLDKSLISNKCMNYTQNTHIFHAGIKTDHKCISMSINFSQIKRDQVGGN